MIVALIVDDNVANTPGNELRKKSVEEVKLACERANAELTIVPYEGVAQNKADFLDRVYNSDVLILDMSVKIQQGVLLYTLSVRETMKLFDNIVLVTFPPGKTTEEVANHIGQNTKLIPYTSTKNGTLVSLDLSVVQSDIWEDDSLRDKLSMGRSSLWEEIHTIIHETRSRDRAPMKDKFLADLRSDREHLKGEQLRERLRAMRRRLDDPELLSPEILLNMLLSYRECEDYKSMVKLIDDVRSLRIPSASVDSDVFTYYYAFALNGRRLKGDREKALQKITELLKTSKNPSADMYGLLGRIHKDRFLESQYKDEEALQLAIESYRNGFKSVPNEYLGVNLATLLVCSGQDLSSSLELRTVCNTLNRRMGLKGDVSKLTDYWDLATLFEIRVLSEEYFSAVDVLDKMFSMEPPAWQLSSTMRNINLICHFRRRLPLNSRTRRSRKLFDFWTEFLADVDRSDCNVTKTDASSTVRDMVDYRTHFPVLVMGSHIDRWEPAFLDLNIEKDPKDIRISFYDRDRQHLRQSRSCDIPEEEEEESIRVLEDCVRQDDDHVFYLEDIKGISMTKQRSVYLFTVFYSLDFTFKFSCENVREQFCSVVRDQFLSEEQLGDLVLEDSSAAPLEFEYENDERELGRGSFGVVYVGRLVTSQRKIAIKEIPADDSSQFQEVVEEIRLHSRLAHPNIVCYLGAVLQDGHLKILMELVPGGSLTSLLKKYGPLKEPAVAEYSEQILQGLNYLHSHRILHRDIKADNILIDQFTGVVKISDFGVSKRLVGLHAQAQSFKGTVQYMAPELIDNRQGYGFSIDIWSFGCTVVQMLTGSIPFKEYDNAGAILYKCGNFGTGPAIPDYVSDPCRTFVLRTFEPKAVNRPTAAVLLSDPFIRPYRKQRSKTPRPPATYGHTPSHRSHFHQLHPEPFDRFISETTEPRSSSFKNGIFETSGLVVEDFTSGLVPSIAKEKDKDSTLSACDPSSRTLCISVPDGLDSAANKTRRPSVLDNRRGRLFSEAQQLTPLKIDGVLTPGMLGSSSECVNSERTDGTPKSISATPEPFQYVKKENDSKCSLRKSLASQRSVFLNAWHAEVIKSGCRLPLMSSTNSGVDLIEPGSDTHQSKRTKTAIAPTGASETSERKLLECLFDMLLDNLLGGVAWNMMDKCISKSVVAQPRSAFNVIASDTAENDLIERFESIIQKLKGHGYRDDVSLFTSSWLFKFLNSALDRMWKAFEKPLCDQLKSPHELLAWHKFIRDSVVSALAQLTSINKYAELEASNSCEKSTVDQKVKLRRNRTLVVRADNTGSEQLSKVSFPPRVRPISLSFNRIDSSEDSKDDSLPSNSSEAISTDVRPRVSFIDENRLSHPISLKDSVTGTDPSEIGYSRGKPNLRRLAETDYDSELEASIEETCRLKVKLARVMSDLNGLLKANIQMQEVELERLRDMTSELPQPCAELQSGHDGIAEWFSSMQLPEADLHTLINNVTDESDFLAMVTKEDLYRMKLCFPTVIRVWRAVTKIREVYRITMLPKL